MEVSIQIDLGVMVFPMICRMAPHASKVQLERFKHVITRRLHRTGTLAYIDPVSTIPIIGNIHAWRAWVSNGWIWK